MDCYKITLLLCNDRCQVYVVSISCALYLSNSGSHDTCGMHKVQQLMTHDSWEKWYNLIIVSRSIEYLFSPNWSEIGVYATVLVLVSSFFSVIYIYGNPYIYMAETFQYAGILMSQFALLYINILRSNTRRWLISCFIIAHLHAAYVKWKYNFAQNIYNLVFRPGLIPSVPWHI